MYSYVCICTCIRIQKRALHSSVLVSESQLPEIDVTKMVNKHTAHFWFTASTRALADVEDREYQERMRTVWEATGIPSPPWGRLSLYIYIHIYIHVCIYVYMYMYIYIYTHTNVCVYLYVYVHKYIRIYMCSHKCMYLYTYIYIYIYTSVSSIACLQKTG